LGIGLDIGAGLMKLTDPVTQWSFDCLADAGRKPLPGGLALQNVTHDQHNFAKDIRVVGIWIETEVVEPSGAVVSTSKQFYVLDNATFDDVSAIEMLPPAPVTNPIYTDPFKYLRESDTALAFTEYFKNEKDHYAGYAVTARFHAPTLLTALPNCVHSGLTVEQLFLFSRYSKTPKHEPTGGISAARFHPMIRYAFSPNTAHDPRRRLTRVSSIRFDYRMHLYLDRHYNVATNETLAQLGNQAGVFADSDTFLGTAGTSIGSFAWNIRKPKASATAFSAGLFDAAEKPLVRELTAPGLAHGFSIFTTTTIPGGEPFNVRCWDNLHWWGSRGPGSPLVSTPGAFHCAHMHWRWGAAAVAVKLTAFDPRFNPTVWPAGMPAPPRVAGMWGPLVDPSIWIQSIRFAVTKYDPRLDPNRGAPAAALSKNDWKTLFNPGLNRAPAEMIYSGEDIVLWYSSEVHSSVTLPTGYMEASQPVPPLSPPTYQSAASGTVFLHGIFFAHDAERPGMSVGSTDPMYRPTSEAMIRKDPGLWFRAAN
jgi:hypothetical protein